MRINKRRLFAAYETISDVIDSDELSTFERATLAVARTILKSFIKTEVVPQRIERASAGERRRYERELSEFQDKQERSSKYPASWETMDRASEP